MGDLARRGSLYEDGGGYDGGVWDGKRRGMDGGRVQLTVDRTLTYTIITIMRV